MGVGFLECRPLSEVCVGFSYGGNFDKDEGLPFPISLTRSGIPRCVPTFHRRKIARRDEAAEKLVKFDLSIFSLYKLILIGKKMNFQYTSIVKPCSPIPDEFLVEFRSMVVELAERYVPPLFEIPMNLGLRWHAIWTSPSVVRAQSCPIQGLTDLYSRAVWDLFSIALWDKSYLLSPTSDQHQNFTEGRLWPFHYKTVNGHGVT